MDNVGGDEFFIFIISFYLTGVFLTRWYLRLFKSWPPERNDVARFILGCLPLAALAIMLYTLKVLASFDVVNSPFFITFYVLLGFVWLRVGVASMFCFFDLSWTDDAVNMSNKAALAAVVGGFLGLTLIYSGANIGDGPGWWCVVFAGGLGFAAWFFLGDAVDSAAGVSERITIERDLGCGIRFGLYLLASGFILARASAGDWTSFRMTVVEFFDVYDKWPMLLLTVLASIIERFYPRRTGSGDGVNLFCSALIGAFYVAYAIVFVFVLPSLPHNPIYRSAR